MGNGRLGLLYLTVTPEVYNTLSQTRFIPPVNPGPTTEYPDNATQFQIRAVDKAHASATKLFNQYDACYRALKQLLIGAVDDMFINILSDPHVGYANETTLRLLTHLYNTYEKTNPRDLRKNAKIMNEVIDLNLPIETFFRRIEDCVDYATAGKTPFSPEQVVNSSFYTVQKSGVITEDIRK